MFFCGKKEKSSKPFTDTFLSNPQGDGDKCAMVNFGGNEKSILGGMKKFNIKSVDFVHKFNN